MESFEQEVRHYLTLKAIRFEDRTESHHALDFALLESNVFFDVKEKKQRFTMGHWPGTVIPERYFFILDDLAARKILLNAPRSFLMIRNCTEMPSYYVFSVVDLLCIPKVRVRRTIERHNTVAKGKWYIDLRHGKHWTTLAQAFEYMMTYPDRFPLIFDVHLDCWGTYEGENILSAGIPRKPHHWSKDLDGK